MNMTDPIADMLTRIRNGALARHQVISIPASKLKLSIAKILKDEGFIKDFDIVQEQPQHTLRLFMKYGSDKKPVVTGLKRISKPGLRVYAKRVELPRVMGGLGISIVSTPQGVMTGQEAWRKGLGGEVICYVW